MTASRKEGQKERGGVRKKIKHYTSHFAGAIFHPARDAWRIELGALSSLQMWQISTVAPFDTKCSAIIELVQP